MKIIFRLTLVMVWIAVPAFAAPSERPGLILILDAGVPLPGAEGQYGADFGKSFLDLSVQARLGGNFCLEGAFSFFPNPRPGDEYFYNSDGFELAVDAVWKLAQMKRAGPFVKIGLSYAWINSNNAWREIYYPDAGRERDRFLGLNAGGGVECRLSGKLLLRLGAAFTFVPNDGEGSVASWGKLFAGLGIRLK